MRFAAMLGEVFLFVMDKTIRNNVGNILYVIVAVILCLSTYKYVEYGEVYFFSSPITGECVCINDNLITQGIIIDEKSEYLSHSYGIYLIADTSLSSGYVQVWLYQDNKMIDEVEIKPDEIKSDWYYLDGLNSKKLHPGDAEIQIIGLNLDRSVYLGIGYNYYNFPDCSGEGISDGYVLNQTYHYYFNNFEYKLRCGAFAVLLMVNALMIYLMIKGNEKKFICVLAHCSLVISYICLTYIYSSQLFLSPAWAEGVNNFMHNARTLSIKDNLLISDSGYLPMIQRFISILTYKILRFDMVSGLYFMQILAYVITGWFLGFFLKIQFADVFELKYRYALSFWLVIIATYYETGAFINFVVYGIVIIFMYFLADSEKWNRLEFIIICLIGFMLCISKGSYVTILPYMFVCLFLFYKNLTKRDLLFMCCCMVGALIQLIYYFVIPDNVNWIDTTDSSLDQYYYIKLILQACIDVPSQLLILIIGEHVADLNGISILLIALFWIIAIFFFVKEIVFSLIKKKKLCRNICIIYGCLIYLWGHSLFLRLTIYGVNPNEIASDIFWQFSSFMAKNYRTQIFLLMASFTLLVVILRLLKDFFNELKYRYIFVVIFILCIFVSDSRFQIKGIGNDDYINSRNQLVNLTSEELLLTDYTSFNLIENGYGFVPIQPTQWVYTQNSNIICLGVDLYGWCSATPLSVWSGHINLTNCAGFDDESEIIQIIVIKNCLVDRNDFQIILRDSNGNILSQKSQANINYQKTTYFLFEEGVSNVSEIEVLNDDGKNVCIEDCMYIITKNKD